MELNEPLICLRLLNLYENHMSIFEDNTKHVNNALTYSLKQIKSDSLVVKKAAITTFSTLVRSKHIHVSISTFEQLINISREQTAELLKSGTLNTFLEAIISLLPTWEDREDKVFQV